MTISITNQKRIRACAFCRARLADGPRGSAAAAAADSDGKEHMLDERNI